MILPAVVVLGSSTFLVVLILRVGSLLSIVVNAPSYYGHAVMTP